MIGRLPGHRLSVTSLAFSPNGAQVLTGGQDKHPALCVEDCSSATVWDTAELKLSQRFSHTASVTAVAFSPPDGSQVVTGGQDNITRLWEVEMEVPLNSLMGHTRPMTSIAISPDGAWVLTGSQDKTVRLWYAATGELLHLFSHPAPLTSVAFTPPLGRWILTAAGSVTYVWDTTTGELAFAVGHADQVSSVAAAPDGTLILTGSWDKTGQLWSFEE
jgi:WD40 repeat protein